VLIKNQCIKCGTFPPGLSQRAQADSALAATHASTAASRYSSIEAVHACVVTAIAMTVVFGELE